MPGHGHSMKEYSPRDCRDCGLPHGKRGHCPTCGQCCGGDMIPVPHGSGHCVMWLHCDSCGVAWPGQVTTSYPCDLSLVPQLRMLSQYTPSPGRGAIEVQSDCAPSGWLNPKQDFVCRAVDEQVGAIWRLITEGQHA